MELLPQGQKNSTKVSYEDQQKINEFSKLIMKKDMIEQELQQQKQEKEYLEDVSLELELVDEDELVKYRIGMIFVHLKQSEVIEQLEKDKEVLDANVDRLENEEVEIESQIKKLKTSLYAKFGDNINLER